MARGQLANTLIIFTSLKLSPASGPLGPWIGPGAVAHFANLRIPK